MTTPPVTPLRDQYDGREWSPPHDSDAEAAVLGAVLAAPNTFGELAAQLQPSDFYGPANETLWRVFSRMQEAGKPLDPVTVLGELRAAGITQPSGEDLHTMLAAALPANATYHAGIVLQHSRARQVVALGQRLTQLGHASNGDLDQALITAMDEVETLLRSELFGGTSGQAVESSWRPVDLGPYLAGEIKRPEPSIGLARADGLRLMYAGKEHTVIGEMESGKSWFAAASVAAQLAKGHHVIYVHFEEADPTDTIDRLQALGIPVQSILERFAFVGPDAPVNPRALAALLDPAPALVVLDGVNEAMALHGQGIRDEDGAAAFRRRLVKPCTAVGAAVLCCDHVVKDRERRGRDPLGSIHKGNGLTGSLILLENAAPFGRGERGCSHIFVTKDRPGHLRRYGRPDRRLPGKTFIGSLIVDDTRTYVGYLDLAFIEPPEQDPESRPVGTRDEQDDERVLSVVAELVDLGIQATGRSVRARSGISKERTADALTRLTLDGRLREASGSHSARIFSIPTDATASGPSGPVLKDRGPLDHYRSSVVQDHSGPLTQASDLHEHEAATGPATGPGPAAGTSRSGTGGEESA